jgi:hypothetical protein
MQREKGVDLRSAFLAMSLPLSSLILTITTDQSPEERFVWELGVGLGHGIAA